MGHSIPKTSSDTLHEVVAGYNKTTEVGESVDDEEVANVRDVGEDLARRQKKFFNEIGVLNKDGYDYFLTDVGDELGEMVRFNQMDEAMGIYAELLSDWEPTDELLAHLDEDGLDKADLIDKIALVTATEMNHSRKTSGAGALIDILTNSGFLTEDNGTYYAADGSAPEAEEPSGRSKEASPASGTEKVDPHPEAPVAANGGAQTAASSVQTGGIDISLDISGSDDPENVRQLLLAIRQGTEADVDDYDQGEE